MPVEPPLRLPTDDLEKAVGGISAGALVQELRTSLTTVHGFLETLLLRGDDLEEPVKKRMLEIAYRNASMLSQRVGEIIELQRLWTGQVVMAPRSLDLAAEVRQFLQDREGMLSAHEVVLDIDEGIYVHGDPDGLRQVLGNILGDAVRHSRPATTISIIGLSQYDQAMVLISDGGDAIDPDDLAGVFDPAYQGHPARRGCGVGLAVAHEYVTAMGGEIQVRSEEGHGTTVWFHLPLTQSRYNPPIPMPDVFGS